MIVKQKFDTSRLIILGSIIMTVWLLVTGLIAPDSITMSFASSGIIHTILRGGVLIMLIGAFMSSPPRSSLFRVLLGAMSTTVLIVSFVLMSGYQIGILDALLYLLVSIVLALEALEFDTVPTVRPSTSLSES